MNEEQILKHRSRHGAIAYILGALTKRVESTKVIAESVTAENKAQSNKDLAHAVESIKIQVGILEYHLAKAIDEGDS